MAAGRPVVTTAVGGAADAVRDGTTGFLVRPREPEALAAAIERLLRDPELRRAMGEAGQRIARAEYHASRVIASLEALYERLLRTTPLTGAPDEARGRAAARRRVAAGAPAGGAVLSAARSR
jgi:glycogen synthase